MIIYIVNILIVLISSVLCNFRFKWIRGRVIEGKKIYSIIVCMSFSFIMAFRDLSVGVDTAPYSRIFGIISKTESYIDALREAPLTAPVYILFSKTLSFISKDPQIVVIVSSLIINVGLMLFINKVSEDLAVSYLCWIGLTLFYSSMNGSRQILALVLSLHAILLLSENLKSAKAWILFVIAILIHSTALILVFAIAGILLTNKISDNKMQFILSGILSIVISFGYGAGVRLILRLVPRYVIYTSGDSEYSIFNNTGEGRIVLLYAVLLCVTILWMKKNRKMEFKDVGFIDKMFPAVLFGAVFGIVNSKNELINRLLWYYLGIYVVFIPAVISQYKKHEKFILKVIIVGILLAYSMLSLRENQNGVVPYNFFWD